jgi:GGDEF domain-containing protein
MTALCPALRHSDVVGRYGQTQFLALLADLVPVACAALQERVNARLSPAVRAAVHYVVISL